MQEKVSKWKNEIHMTWKYQVNKMKLGWLKVLNKENEIILYESINPLEWIRLLDCIRELKWDC